MRTYVVRSIVGLCALAVGGVAACGGDNATPGTPVDSGGTDGVADAAALPADGASALEASTGSSDGDHGADASCITSETDAGTCNAIGLVGPSVTATCSMAEPPQAQGGTIEDGFYELDSFTYYGVCPVAPDIASTTWQICGNRWDVVQVVPDPTSADGGTLPPERFNFATAVQGVSVTYVEACGNTVTLGPRQYTATPGHLMFVYPDVGTPGRTFVSTFVKR